MIQISLQEAGVTMGCQCSSDYPRMSLPRICTDSRAALPGDAFLALQGEKFDGHAYISEAVRKGVRVVIHRRDWQPDVRNDVFFMPVPDTTRALQDLAARVREKWDGRVIAVTGSMGKTTTRQFAAVLLEERYRVHQSSGNLNNHFGVPMTLLDLEPHHEVAVLELGMNHSGEIRRLGEICRPDLGVITNVAPAHLEFFPSIDAIAEAKGELLESLQNGGIFVYNSDDRRVCRLASRFAGNCVSFGFAANASVRIESFHFQSLSEMDFELVLPESKVQATVPFAGRHFLYNLAAAAAVADALGLTAEQILRGFNRLEAPAGRGEILQLTRNGQRIELWDDSYNANPRAVETVLETLANLPVEGRRIAVLGDMLELGPEQDKFHRESGVRAAGSGLDLLIAIGPLSRETIRGAVEAGLEANRARHFEDPESAGSWLAAQLRDQDVVLVKGSRGIHTEAVVESIRRVWEVAA